MIKHKNITLITALLLLTALAFTAVAAFAAQALPTTDTKSSAAYASVLGQDQVLDLQVIVDEDNWSELLDNAIAEEYIPATVIINGKKLEQVGIRAKGNSSLSMVASDPTTDRYSFKIEFDHYIKGQTWLGLDKIVVNNMHGDATYLKEYLSYDLMNFIGVDTPLCSFADISVNGSTWGFYLAVECLEESFAERIYGSDYGQLYKPESMDMGGGGAAGGGGAGAVPDSPGRANSQASGSTLVYTDDEVSSYSAIFDNEVFTSTQADYQCVIAALRQINAGEDLETVVDVDKTLRYFAANTVLVNLDSYVSNLSHNYYLYEKDGQLTILPWDFNLSFGGFQSGTASSVVNFPIDTPVSGVSLDDRPLLGKLLAVDAYSDLYHSYIAEIVENYFHSGLFATRVDKLNTAISPYVVADPSAFYTAEEQETAVIELKKTCSLRAESLIGQLEGSIPSTTEDQAANPDTLIDASSVNLAALGSMNNNGTGGVGGGFPGSNLPEGAGGEMPEMPDGADATGRFGGQMPEGELPEGGFPDTAAGDFGGQIPERLTPPTGDEAAALPQVPGGARPDGGMIPPGNQQTPDGAELPQTAGTISQQNHISTWLLLALCFVCLGAGIVFVFQYKRRN